jgi:hypothetical protein
LMVGQQQRVIVARQQSVIGGHDEFLSSVR